MLTQLIGHGVVSSFGPRVSLTFVWKKDRKDQVNFHEIGESTSSSSPLYFSLTTNNNSSNKFVVMLIHPLSVSIASFILFEHD